MELPIDGLFPRQVLDDQEKQSRINELYDLVQKSEGMSNALPEIVDRLEALQGLHGQGEIIQETKRQSQEM